MYQGGSVIRHAANGITVLRIPLAIAMLLVQPFSAAFWSLYVCAGLSDIADGFVARKLRRESALGAKLDSFADFVFVSALAVYVWINIELPPWLWLCILCIALLRFVSCGVGFYKYHAFAALHTYANKITGALLFASPILYRIWGVSVTGVVVCGAAFASALEELLITVTAAELDRDRRSLFMR